MMIFTSGLWQFEFSRVFSDSDLIYQCYQKGQSRSDETD